MDQQNMTMETEICHNCKREVPQSNYLMHVAHCARNMAVCPVCGDAVPKAHLKDHRQQQHSLVECKDCRFKVQSGALEQHRASSCGKRVVACQYCELDLPHSDIPDHENYCGARTERCMDCGELVMLKYKKLHLDSNHGFLKLDDEPGPSPSWETPVPVVTKKSPVKSSLSTMAPMRSTLPTSATRNNNNVNDMRASGTAASDSQVNNKTDYKKPLSMHSTSAGNSCASATSDATTTDGANYPGTVEPQPRDLPRTFVSPYDASEDLRAKVKLARHDLNEIKNSYIMTEDRKHDYQRGNRHPSLDLPATNRPNTRDKFITNLVPYEKNKSYQVNARSLDDKPAKNYYNYLGAKEEPPLQPLASPVTSAIPPQVKPVTSAVPPHVKPVTSAVLPQVKPVAPVVKPVTSVVPVADVGLANGNGTGALPKRQPVQKDSTGTGNSAHKVSNGTVPKQKDLGAAPRPTRRRAPPPPVNIPVPVVQQPQMMTPSSLDEVTLPCEFCDKMIPAARLVQHETGCRPDLAQLHTTETPPLVAADPMSPALIAPGLSPEVQLPCEFCFSLYPASKLLSHQALCDV